MMFRCLVDFSRGKFLCVSSFRPPARPSCLLRLQQIATSTLRETARPSHGTRRTAVATVIAVPSLKSGARRTVYGWKPSMARPFSSVPETSGGLPKICAGIFVFTSTPISSLSKFAASSSLRMHQTIRFRDFTALMISTQCYGRPRQRTLHQHRPQRRYVFWAVPLGFFGHVGGAVQAI